MRNLTIAAISALLFGCTSGGAVPGTAGASCRISEGSPCDPPLECIGSICTPPGGLADGSPFPDPDGSTGPPPDARPPGSPDARPGSPDARPGAPDAATTSTEKLLTHSLSQSIESGVSLACFDEGTGSHRDSSYYRAFRLSDYGITGNFAVSQIQIGIETATSTGGTQPITLRLHALSGPLALENLTLVATSTTAVVDQTFTVASFPHSGVFFPGETLVVEVFTPAGAGNQFFIGANAAGQTSPSYLMAEACGFAAPTDLATIGGPNMHIVMNVRGTLL